MKYFVFVVVLLAAFVAVYWIGAFEFDSLPLALEVRSSESSKQTRCTTANGKIYYGAVPEGVVCRSEQAIDGQLSVYEAPRTSVLSAIPKSQSLSCDGRTHCAQMRSCTEAKYYLANCPGVQMDGDGDGIPCEQQWCG